MTLQQPDSVFVRDGDYFVPTALARGPWDARAQHGGAPVALLAHVAETTVDDDGFFLARLTFELTRPIPVAPLRVQVESGRGRNVRRLHLTIEHDGKPVGRAIALFLRQVPMPAPQAAPRTLTPLPQECTEHFASPGLTAAEGETLFVGAGVEVRIARGSSRQPGPVAAWLRLQVPVVAGAVTTPAMRTMAAADFGNGTSWVVSAEDYLFTNTDLTVYLHRAPVGEWIGLDSETIATNHGLGLATSTLYDQQGRIGIAHQNLMLREREAL